MSNGVEEDYKLTLEEASNSEDEEDEDDDDDGVDEKSIEQDDDMEHRPTDVSFHRPTNTEELLALQQVPDDISTLFGEDGIIAIEDLIIADNDEVESEDIGNKMSTPMSKVMYLEKIMRLLGELLTTEIDYVRDLGLLCRFLDECTYCSKPAVHSFVNSTTFIGKKRKSSDNVILHTNLILFYSMLYAYVIHLYYLQVFAWPQTTSNQLIHYFYNRYKSKWEVWLIWEQYVTA